MAVQVVVVAARAGAQVAGRGAALAARTGVRVGARVATKVAGSAARAGAQSAQKAGSAAKRSARSPNRARPPARRPARRAGRRPSDARKAYDRARRLSERGRGDDRDEPQRSRAVAPVAPRGHSRRPAGGLAPPDLGAQTDQVARTAGQAARLTNGMRRAAWRRLSPRRRVKRAIDLKPRIGRRALVVAGVLSAITFLTLVLPLFALTQAEESAQALDAILAEYDPGAELVACGGTQAEMAERTEIPLEALGAYCSAATAWEADWAVLAGIGKLECDHGRSPDPGCPRGSVNECGARGPMQFLGNTWRSGTDPVPSGECPGASSFTGNPVGPPIPKGEEATGYATDSGDDNIADPWDWRDATHAAARYLLRNGLKEDERGAIYAYNQSSDYVARVQELAAGYRAAVPNMIAGGCPSVERRGGTEPITESSSTTATRAMANAVIACFGRGPGIGCYSPRLPEAKFEHPRGRACDFMLTSGGVARDEERSRGQAMAEWVAANAAELNVIYVIWYNRSWNPSDGNIPWNQWSDYGCGGCDPSAAHYDHVHVSVKLQPGDPDWAHCIFGIACTE